MENNIKDEIYSSNKTHTLKEEYYSNDNYKANNYSNKKE